MSSSCALCTSHERCPSAQVCTALSGKTRFCFSDSDFGIKHRTVKHQEACKVEGVFELYLKAELRMCLSNLPIRNKNKRWENHLQGLKRGTGHRSPWGQTLRRGFEPKARPGPAPLFGMLLCGAHSPSDRWALPSTSQLHRPHLYQTCSPGSGTQEGLGAAWASESPEPLVP